MSGDALPVLLAIIGTVVGVAGIGFTARTFYRAQSKERADALQGRYDAGYKQAQKDDAPELQRLRDQRDDARKTRDRLQNELDRAQARIEQLEDELRKR